jgi:NAD(P)H-dependent flavin oxidoreductase YrpB (nitropropane dioxygenase family)
MVEVPWELPLVQAPIGPAATPELVIAVSEIGALGTLAASWTSRAELRDQIRRIRSRLVRPYCVNFVLAFEQRGRLRVALEEEVPFVSFSWGVDRGLIKLAHDAGASVLVQVGDLADAIHAADANADVLIVQGIEAGGHVEGRMPTVELVKRVRAAVSSPLVAAGGIGDSAATARARAAGADAFAWGTPFLAAHEADVHPEYLSQLIDAEATDTALATAFDEGWPDAAHRVIRNTTLRDWEQAGRPGKGARPGEGDVIATRNGTAIHRYSDAQPTTATSGQIEAMAMYAGTSVSTVTRGEPATTIAKRLASAFR